VKPSDGLWRVASHNSQGDIRDDVQDVRKNISTEPQARYAVREEIERADKTQPFAATSIEHEGVSIQIDSPWDDSRLLMHSVIGRSCNVTITLRHKPDVITPSHDLRLIVEDSLPLECVICPPREAVPSPVEFEFKVVGTQEYGDPAILWNKLRTIVVFNVYHIIGVCP
jgi:hypothetical protein